MASTIAPFPPQAESPLFVFHLAEPRDCGGPELVAVFNPSTPDRTEAVKGLAPSPVPFLLDSFHLLSLLGVKLAAIACNTMHYWYDLALMDPRAAAGLSLPVVHMIRATAETLHRGGASRAGLLATTGTVSTGIYQDACRRLGVALEACRQGGGTPRPDFLDCLGRVKAEVYRRHGVSPDGAIPPDRFEALAAFLQELLGEQEGLAMESIYGVFGIKAGFTGGTAELLMRRAALRLAERGAEALVLGCTEIPLVLRGERVELGGKEVPLVDTTRVVARSLSAAGAEGATSLGIAGGLGPAATIDMLDKMGLDSRGLQFLNGLYGQTIAALQERGVEQIGDGDHVKLVFIRTCRPQGYAEALHRAGVAAAAFTDFRTTSPTWLGSVPLIGGMAELVEAGLAAKATARAGAAATGA